MKYVALDVSAGPWLSSTASRTGSVIRSCRMSLTSRYVARPSMTRPRATSAAPPELSDRCGHVRAVRMRAGTPVLVPRPPAGPGDGSEVAGVDDPVGVPLLGEEALPVLREVGVDGV